MPSILLFEAEPVISSHIHFELENRGFVILVAFTQTEALAICQAQRPDLAIINFHRHYHSDGMRFARLLYARFGMRSLIITGARARDLALSPNFNAAQEVLYKPFSRIQLRKKLDDFLALHRQD